MKKAKWILAGGILLLVILLGGYVVFRGAKYPNAAARARDTQRKADLASLQLALEMYFNNEGKYPMGRGDKVFISRKSEEFNKMMVGPYLAKTVDEPHNLTGKDWPQYLYWQVDKDIYFLFGKLENTGELTEKVLPPGSSKEKVKTYEVRIGETTIEYNFWLTNWVDLGLPSPTVRPTSPTSSPSPTPTLTPAPRGLKDGVAPGQKKK